MNILSNEHWIYHPPLLLDSSSSNRATQRQSQLTKPPKSLGQLEEIAIRLAAMQGIEKPSINHIHISVFAADHGVAKEGVSAFPQDVTVQMIHNFANGGAAISVMAEHLGAHLEIINVGTATDPGPINEVVDDSVGPGTNNICQQAAMDESQLNLCLESGKNAVIRAMDNNAEIFIAGEMGIANTTSATALACALLSVNPSDITGPGTGLDTTGVNHKIRIIKQALELQNTSNDLPASILQKLGGFEIAAMVGAYIYCAQQGLPAIVDGFIATAAALVATQINPKVSEWLFFAHQSAEPGHKIILNAMKVTPLLSLDMRLGEGSGAAVAVSLLQTACVVHKGMATFEEAAVTSAHP